MEKSPSRPLPQQASPPATQRAALPPVFVHCIDGIYVTRLPALCGICIVVSHGTPCAAVGGRHDLLAERAGQNLPHRQH